MVPWWPENATRTYPRTKRNEMKGNVATHTHTHALLCFFFFFFFSLTSSLTHIAGGVGLGTSSMVLDDMTDSVRLLAPTR